MQSIGTCSSSSTFSTPTCAQPLPPPPASARPIRGRPVTSFGWPQLSAAQALPVKSSAEQQRQQQANSAISTGCECRGRCHEVSSIALPGSSRQRARNHTGIRAPRSASRTGYHPVRISPARLRWPSTCRKPLTPWCTTTPTSPTWFPSRAHGVRPILPAPMLSRTRSCNACWPRMGSASATRSGSPPSACSRCAASTIRSPGWSWNGACCAAVRSSSCPAWCGWASSSRSACAWAARCRRAHAL